MQDNKTKLLHRVLGVALPAVTGHAGSGGLDHQLTSAQEDFQTNSLEGDVSAFGSKSKKSSHKSSSKKQGDHKAHTKSVKSNSKDSGMSYSTEFAVGFVGASAVGVAGIGVVEKFHLQNPLSIKPEDSDKALEAFAGATVKGTAKEGTYSPAKAKKGTVLFCHDLNQTGASAKQFAEKLVAEGFEVHVFTYKSHQEPGKELFTYGQREALEILEKIGSVKPDVVVGVGLGADASILAAKDKEVSVVVVDPVQTATLRVEPYMLPSKYALALTASIKDDKVQNEIADVSYVDAAAAIKGNVRIVTRFNKDTEKELFDGTKAISAKCKGSSVVTSDQAGLFAEVAKQVKELCKSRNPEPEQKPDAANQGTGTGTGTVAGTPGTQAG